MISAKRPSPKSSGIYADLHSKIRLGVLAPGKAIPKEGALAKHYGVCRETVRKALGQLDSEGLITRVPGQGTFVRHKSQTSFSQTNTPSGTLRLMTYWPTLQAENLSKLAATFSATYPKTHIELVQVNPLDTNEELARLSRAGNPPDIVHLTARQLDDARRTTELCGISELLDESHLSDLYPQVAEALVYDGQLMAYPFTFSPVMLAYNVEHFREANLPPPDGTWTWDDFLKAIDRLNEATPASYNRQALVLSAAINRWSVLLAQWAGRQALDWRTHPAMTSKGAVEACRFAYALAQRDGVIQSGEVPDLDFFRSGLASMTLCSFCGFSKLRSPGMNVDVAPVPCNGPREDVLLISGFALPSQSKQRDLATEFLRFVACPKTQAFLRASGAGIPPRRTIAENPDFGNAYSLPRSHLSFMYALKNTHVPQRGVTPHTYRMSRLLVAEFWAGLLDASDLCQRIDKLIEQDLKARGETLPAASH